MEIAYTAHATATGGGRDKGHSKTDDGKVEVNLSTPKEMGGSGEGTNPEQLFAVGYSACFLGALRFVAGQQKVKLPDNTQVSADVGIGKRDDGEGFGLKIILTISVPELDSDTAQDLVDRAHIVCPYSHATKGNVDVRLVVA